MLAVGSDGTLTAAAGSPVSSGGIEPVSIAVHGDLVYVANEGNGTTGSNYTGFTLADDGRLTPLSGSTVPLPPTALPGDILFNGTGKNLIGIEVGTTDPSTFLIDSFLVGADGRLTPAAGSPFPAEAAGPFGSEFSPTDPHHLYVSNAHGGDGQRIGVGVLREPEREAEVDRRLAVRGRGDRAVLGGDLPRRPVPVHGQHRKHDDLELPDPRERVAAT